MTATPAIVTADGDEPFSSMVTQLGGAKNRPAGHPTQTAAEKRQISRHDVAGNRESNSSGKKGETE